MVYILRLLSTRGHSLDLGVFTDGTDADAWRDAIVARIEEDPSLCSHVESVVVVPRRVNPPGTLPPLTGPLPWPT